MASPLIHLRSDYMPYLKGYYRFKDTLTTDGWGNYANKSDYVTFNSNNKSYELFSNYHYDEENMNYWYLMYGEDKAYLFRIWDNYTQSVVRENVWVNDNYKVVNFGPTEKYVTDDFYNWLIFNADKIGDRIPITTNLDNVIADENNSNYITSSGSVNLIFYAKKGYKFPPTVTPTWLMVQYASFDAVLLNDTTLRLTLKNPTSTNVMVSIRCYDFDTSVLSFVLYNNTADSKVVNKKQYLKLVDVITGTFRNDTSITDPIVKIEYDGIIDFNYIFIPMFNRYYYLNTYNIVSNKIYELVLHIDVLNTYYDDLMNLDAFINRTEYDYNPNIIDKSVMIEQGVDIEVIDSTYNIFESTDASSYSYVLIGGMGVEENNV